MTLGPHGSENGMFPGGSRIRYTSDMSLNLAIETEREDDGRWIAEIPSLPGVLVYGDTRDEAVAHVQALALRVLADRIDRGETVPDTSDLFSVVP